MSSVDLPGLPAPRVVLVGDRVFVGSRRDTRTGRMVYVEAEALRVDDVEAVRPAEEPAAGEADEQPALFAAEEAAT